jgi:hypothetical protein
MPNYVKNQIEVIGDRKQIDELLKNVSSKDRCFDFEKISPMPESLRIDSGSTNDRNYAIFLYEEKIDDSPLKGYLSYPWVKKEGITTLEEVYEYFKTKAPDGQIYNRNIAKQMHENIQKYGAKDWYDWSCNNWGTKWNASDSTIDENIITFETAWATPVPIIEKLSIDYPNLEFVVSYADEDIGSNCGIYKMKNGNIISDEKGDIVFACEMWGYDPADYDDSYRRDKTIDTILDKKEINE